MHWNKIQKQNTEKHWLGIRISLNQKCLDKLKIWRKNQDKKGLTKTDNTDNEQTFD